MKRIAVVGSGISGLSAAYYLSRRHEVHVFERDNRLGGHTHTVMVDSNRGPIPVDTGFIVHNDRTYPNFCRLMAELGVETQPSDMSFAVTGHDGAFEYSSRGLGGFFAQRRNYFSRDHYTLLREILRFNREAPKLLANPDAEGATLGDFLDAGRYSPVFVDRYLIPMAGAVWSMAPEVLVPGSQPSIRNRPSCAVADVKEGAASTVRLDYPANPSKTMICYCLCLQSIPCSTHLQGRSVYRGVLKDAHFRSSSA